MTKRYPVRRDPHIDADGSRDAILHRWTDSFTQLRPFRGNVLDDRLAGEIEARTVDTPTEC